MNDKRIFVDTNILIYTLDFNSDKKMAAIEIMLKLPYISLQVIHELSNVLRKKFKVSYPELPAIVDNFIDASSLTITTKNTVKLACHIGERYGYSYYDSLIIASALENDCDFLYTEDMHQDQIIEHKLQIKNPFSLL